MGAGKSLVGSLAAGRLGVDFIDTDSLIEAQEGASISQLFKESGETYFRGAEERVIAQCLHLGSLTVLSLGGGGVLSDRTRGELSLRGFVVWLKVSPEVACSRIMDHDQRPLLQGEDDIVVVLTELLNRRETLYSAVADLIVETDGKSGDEIVTELFANVQLKDLVGWSG